MDLFVDDKNLNYFCRCCLKTNYIVVCGVIMNSVIPTRKERKKIPVKSVYSHIMRAKLFGILTINSLEGIIHEIDEMLPQEALDGFVYWLCIMVRTS